MPDYFDSPRRKLARAKTDIGNLESERGRFVNDHHWTEPVETNPSSAQKEFKITFTREFPDIFSDLTASTLNNLRSVLDHCGYAAAKCSGVTAPRNAYFPFAVNATEVERVSNGRCKDIPSDIVTLMRDLKPYRAGDGDQLLWAINNTANLDKHGIVTPIAALPRADIIRVSPSLAFRSFPLPAFLYNWDAETNELVYRMFRVGEYGTDYDFRVTVDIAFGNTIEVVGGKPAIGLLHAMTNKVEDALVGIEAKCRLLFPGAF